MQFDFNSVKERMIQSLRSKERWAQVLDSSTIDDLISPFAEEIHRLNNYSDYLIRETKWNLAQNLSSLSSQAVINGYTPRRRVGARGQVRVSVSETFDSPPPKVVVIPKNTIFVADNGLDYVVLDTYTIDLSDDYIDVQVLQGTPLTLNFTALGENFEEFIVGDESIENSYYTITVNGEEYEEVSDIREAEEDDKVFQILNEFDYSGIRIRFGNNINGRKLLNGDSIVFSYYSTDGETGNIGTEDIINEVSSTIYYDDGERVPDVYATNVVNIEGGAPYDTLQDIRRKAPLVNQSVNSATTSTSYQALIEDITGISKVVIRGALEYNEDNNLPFNTFISFEENMIRISAFTDSGEQLSNAQKEIILDELRDRKAPTDIISFEDVIFIGVRFNVEAFASTRQIPLSIVTVEIRNMLEVNYSLFNRDFREPIYKSTITADIDRIPFTSATGLLLSHHNTYLELIHETSFNSAYVADINLDIIPVKQDSIKVYIRDNTEIEPTWEIIGETDVDGNFVAETGYDLTGTSLNFVNGVGVLEVVSGLTENHEEYDIRVFYQIVDEDVILTKRNQILRYDSSNILASYVN